MTDLDPTAIQQELMNLAHTAEGLKAKVTVATEVFYNAQRDLKVLQAQMAYVKQQASTLQSVLKSLTQF
jgi:phosphoserine phosphatase